MSFDPSLYNSSIRAQNSRAQQEQEEQQEQQQHQQHQDDTDTSVNLSLVSPPVNYRSSSFSPPSLTRMSTHERITQEPTVYRATASLSSNTDTAYRPQQQQQKKEMGFGAITGWTSSVSSFPSQSTSDDSTISVETESHKDLYLSSSVEGITPVDLSPPTRLPRPLSNAPSQLDHSYSFYSNLTPESLLSALQQLLSPPAHTLPSHQFPYTITTSLHPTFPALLGSFATEDFAIVTFSLNLFNGPSSVLVEVQKRSGDYVDFHNFYQLLAHYCIQKHYLSSFYNPTTATPSSLISSPFSGCFSPSSSFSSSSMDMSVLGELDEEEERELDISVASMMTSIVTSPTPYLDTHTVTEALSHILKLLSLPASSSSSSSSSSVSACEAFNIHDLMDEQQLLRCLQMIHFSLGNQLMVETQRVQALQFLVVIGPSLLSSSSSSGIVSVLLSIYTVVLQHVLDLSVPITGITPIHLLFLQYCIQALSVYSSIIKNDASLIASAASVSAQLEGKLSFCATDPVFTQSLQQLIHQLR